MPLYAYECPRCEEIFEAMAPMAEAANPKGCPDCGAVSQRRFLPPACVSDTTSYSSERTDFGRQFKSEAMRDFHLAQAKKNGVNVTGKIYDPQLANYPGDPRAWVGSDTDVRLVAEDRNLGIKGQVNVKARGDVSTDRPKPGISEANVRQLVHERMTVDPGQKLSRVVEDVVNDHAPRGGKRIIKAPKRAKR